jgi:FKBP-type peptidyl-prolyl cis-trans isomerase SlyD
MKIQKNSVVEMNYKLTDGQGQLIDQSGDDPLSFLFGIGQIIPGLESALDGREKGDKFSVSIAADQAYGERHDDMVQQVPRSSLQGVNDLQVGMQLEAEADQQKVVVTVTEVSDTHVTVDGNHPLAGVDLNFDVEVVNVRSATAEELEHGHAHGPGGHQH